METKEYEYDRTERWVGSFVFSVVSVVIFQFLCEKISGYYVNTATAIAYVVLLTVIGYFSKLYGIKLPKNAIEEDEDGEV